MIALDIVGDLLAILIGIVFTVWVGRFLWWMARPRGKRS